MNNEKTRSLKQAVHSGRRVWMGSAVLVSLLGLTLPVMADSQAQDKAAIQAVIQKMEKAANARDAEGYVASTHPDFVNIDAKGQETTHGKVERLTKIQKVFTRATQVQGRSTVTHINFTKQGAIVDEKTSMSITLARNGQTLMLKGTGTYRDFWVKEGGVWLQKRSRTIMERNTINGQPVPGS